jgi:hypothetical protein
MHVFCAVWASYKPHPVGSTQSLLYPMGVRELDEAPAWHRTPGGAPRISFPIITFLPRIFPQKCCLLL